jgi:hypothetical protein
MSQTSFFWVLTICFVLDAATIAALGVGWQLQSITIERVEWLVGCAALATTICLAQSLALCAHSTNNVWRGLAGGALLEIGSLSAFVVTLYLDPSARKCYEQYREFHLCTIVVDITYITLISAYLYY